MRHLIDGLYLHDARVLSMGQQEDRFVISLQLDVPAKDRVSILYTLAGAPEVNQQAFPAPGAKHPPLWECDEIELTHKADRRSFAHNVMLSNGCVLRIPFQDVQIQQTAASVPAPSS